MGPQPAQAARRNKRRMNERNKALRVKPLILAGTRRGIEARPYCGSSTGGYEVGSFATGTRLICDPLIGIHGVTGVVLLLAGVDWYWGLSVLIGYLFSTSVTLPRAGVGEWAGIKRFWFYRMSASRRGGSGDAEGRLDSSRTHPLQRVGSRLPSFPFLPSQFRYNPQPIQPAVHSVIHPAKPIKAYPLVPAPSAHTVGRRGRPGSTLRPGGPG